MSVCLFSFDISQNRNRMSFTKITHQNYKQENDNIKTPEFIIWGLKHLNILALLLFLIFSNELHFFNDLP